MDQTEIILYGLIALSIAIGLYSGIVLKNSRMERVCKYISILLGITVSLLLLKQAANPLASTHNTLWVSYFSYHLYNSIREDLNPKSEENNPNETSK